VRISKRSDGCNSNGYINVSVKKQNAIRDEKGEAIINQYKTQIENQLKWYGGNGSLSVHKEFIAEKVKGG